MKGNIYGLTRSAEKKLHKLMKEVVADVKPSKKEIDEARFAINEVMGRLMKKTPKNVEMILAGSAARGTQIKGNSDIDVFLLFPRKLKEEAIEKKGVEIAKSIVNKKKNESYIVKYAEHPYTRLLLGDLNINVDIVPAYKIERASERGTAVDRTQLHNKFVNSKLSERQRDDVRVLKAFLNAHNIYGAEAMIEGFSGYLCELLICHYGSFKNLITGIANISTPLTISFGNVKESALDKKSLVKLFGKRFIVVDPTDPNRNVAANVSEESLFRFVLISRNLLRSPDKDTFYGKGGSDIYSERKLLGIKNILGVDIYALHFTVPNIAEDIIWQQCRKIRLRLREKLRENGFAPLISLQSTEEKNAIIGFFIPVINYRTMKVMGPPIEMGEAVSKFTKSHKDMRLLSVENERIYTIEEVRYPNAESLIREFVSSKTAKLPSNFSAKRFTFYTNRIPERYAKMLYAAYTRKFMI